MSEARPLPIQATGIVLGSCGLVIRGPSGAGKSLLALDLMTDWEQRGKPAFLVGDDRLDLQAADEAVHMHAPPILAGRIELRGLGIVTRPCIARAQVHLVVDLVPDLLRMPEPEAFRTELLGVGLPRCPVPARGVADPAHQYLLVLEALRQV